MGIDRSLLNEFIKITNDKKETKQTQLYGTVVTQGNSKYVKIDGSEIITPVRSTTDIKDDERVIVKIDNHMATITGNMTNPSVGNDRVEFTEGKIDRFDHLFAGNITAENIAANSITSDKILAGSITTDKLMAECIISDKIAADTIEAKHIKSDVIESEHIKAGSIEAEHIKAGIIESDHISSGTITADKIATGTITAGSGIIAEGAIGSAQISSLDVAKLESGTIDTSKIYIAGADGHLQLKGNRLQVFDGLGNRAVERVSVGDVNGDGSKFGLRVRGADGETILLDENGVTSEGITDGSITNNKISDDANIDGAKLNINSVVSKINEDGTETIQGTKIEVDGTTLNTKLSTITNKQTEDGERITQAQSQISANTNAIKLKVDEQTYTTDKKDMTSKLEKNTSEISAMKGQIALKVEQTDIENAKSELEGTIDSKINTAKSDIKITTDAISQTVSNLSQTVSNKADGSTVSSLNSKVSSLETSVNGISGKVTSLEKTTTTLGTQVDAANTNASSALNKANSATTTANNAQNTANTNKSNITDLQGEVSTVKSSVASLEVTTSGISQKVSSVESTTATLSGKVDTANNNATNAQNTANTANATANANKTEISNTKSKVATIETNLSSITSRVGTVETNQTTVNGKVSSLETRMSTAESKITESAITNTVKKNFYTKSETDSQITSKGYQTESQVQQTVNGLEIKVSQSGGYNLVYNGNFKRQFECWEPNSDLWQYGDKVYSPDGRCIYCDGALNTTRTTYIKGTINLDARANAYTLSYWINTSSSGSDGTTNPYRRAELTIYYKDGSASWHSVGYNQTRYDTWEKHVVTIQRPSDKEFSHFSLGLWVRDTTKRVHYSMVMVEKGTMANEWTPNPNEIYAGVTTIDNDGIKVTSTNTNTYTEMDASSFRVSDNNGGTIAEFARTSSIPYLTSGTIEASNVYANNIPKKENYGDIHFIYVNGSTGNDTNDGSQSRPYKTVQRAVDDISEIQNTNVTIYVYNSVQGFTIRGFTGSGVITLSLQDSAVINSGIWLHGVHNRINITNETSSRKPTLKAGISIDDCRCVDIYAVTFRGTNSAGNNISIHNTNYCAVNSCDLGGLNTQLMCAIKVQSSLLWLHGCIGSNITDVVGQYPFSHVMMARGGTSNVPDYSNTLLCNYDGAGRIQNWTGGSFNKTPSSGWNPSYTPTQKTRVWNFNKIWSDETLHGWSNRQELIQGYASTWNTGRWTGYMQMSDGMASIRNTISGGTNLSGRIYVQRTSSSGNSTGSKLCLYASDGTTITTTTSINRGQGVWVSLSSSIIEKIKNGSITYFYLKADSNNTATYFKCESNAKIEITYTN